MAISRKASSSVSLSSSSLVVVLLLQLQICFASETNITCNKEDEESLLLFHQQISSPVPLNWSSSSNCCKWEGVGCDEKTHRVNRLALPEKGLSGIITPSLKNLSFLTYLNLSHNTLSKSLPQSLFGPMNHLQVVDLSYNSLSGSVLEPTGSLNSLPVSIKTLDLSSNKFNGTFDPSLFQGPLSLMVFNVSNNSFTGPIPSFIFCQNASFIRVLELSMNKFSGEIPRGFAWCSNLEVFRAGFNALSGRVPYDLFRRRTLKEISLPGNDLTGPIDYISMEGLTNLTMLELHNNKLTGELPKDIGSLSNLEKLILHTNSFVGPLPPSMMNCTKLQVILVRNNLLEGDVSSVDFSRLQQLQSLDLGHNNFTGEFPVSLCLCGSLTAIRLAYNNISGQLPPCLSQIKLLNHISMSDTHLQNATGALKILMGCKDIGVIFMSRTFKNESIPGDEDMEGLSGFEKLEILTLGGGNFTGQVPNWYSRLKKLKLFNLSYNKLTGPVPTWLGSMPNMVVINFTGNHLTGQLPRELGNLTALRADQASDDFGYLAFPFFFTAGEYNRLFNLPRGLKFDHNNLTGSIPSEIGELKQLQMLELNKNRLSGGIPTELSTLVNLFSLQLSANHLTGEIPESLLNLHFLSSFDVANNSLRGEIPQGGQFDTFPPSAYAGNPELCGSVIGRPCRLAVPVPPPHEQQQVEKEGGDDSIWSLDSLDSPMWIGFVVGFAGVCVPLILHKSWRRSYFGFLSRLKDRLLCARSSRRVGRNVKRTPCRLAG